MSDGTVLDDTVNDRFVLGAEDLEAELVYRRNGRRLVLIHTEVPEALSGQGIGGRLVAAAVDQARVQGLILVPVCPYARRWLEQHPDDTAGVSIGWSSAEPPDPAGQAEEGG